MVETVARAGQAANLAVGAEPSEREKVLSHVVPVVGGTATVRELAEQYRTVNFLTSTALSENDVAVIDELRRTQYLAADPHAADVERLVAKFRDQLEFG